jgi:ABC-type lipoprotein export system ATPase subunit
MVIKEKTGSNTLSLSSDVLAALIDVYKVYKNGGLETVALRGVSLEIHKGEILAIVGPSGSGKSTLIKILGGMLKPTAGSVYWSNCDFDISRLSSNEILKIRKKFMGFIFQTVNLNLIPYLTILQNVELSAKIAGLPKSRERAERLLEKVGLGNCIRFIPGMLSSGERQRAAIASALVADPSLVLMDEPTGNLDPATSETILDLLKECNQETGTAFLIVTHSQQVASIANRILEIRDGILVGSHFSTLNIKELDKSRILTLDRFGRIYLPSYLLSDLNNPKKFRVERYGAKIILTPCTEETKAEVSNTICRVCGRFIKKKTRNCPNCGSPL